MNNVMFDFQGKTVTIKLKTVKFDVKTKAQSLADYTSDSHVIHEVARELLRAEIQACLPEPLRLRLMGKSPMTTCQIVMCYMK